MADIKETLEKLSKATELLQKPTELPQINYGSMLYNIKTDFPVVKIDEESTFAYQMQQKTNQILEKSNEQIRLLNEHNEQLVNNYRKLEDLYALKEQELKDAKQEAEVAKAETKKTKRYNRWMMFLTIIATLVAIASWLLPDIFGGISQ